MYRRAENQHGEADALTGLGETARLTGDYVVAGEQFRDALSICQLIGDRPGEANALAGLGRLALDTGEYRAASEQQRPERRAARLVGSDRVGDRMLATGPL